MINKRGISPLIATVLIIGFTIVLAVLIITWISGTVTEQTEQTDTLVELQNLCLEAVGDVTGTVTGTGPYTVNVNNNGGVDFSNVKVSWLDSGGAVGEITEIGALTGYGSGSSTSTGSSYSSVKLIPVISSGGEEVQCASVGVGIGGSVPSLSCTDSDGDGYGVCPDCGISNGCTNDGDDCDDGNANRNPGETEVCDDLDNDCNSGTVDGSDEGWYNQATSCGVGACASTGVYDCVSGTQTDTCIAGTPGTEICQNGIDEDCDGSDTTCLVCTLDVEVPYTGCLCEGIARYEGYCCSDGWDRFNDCDVPEL